MPRSCSPSASALAGAAPNLPVLIAARVVQGLAGGCLVPISQSVMMEVFPGRARAMALAVWSVGVASGAIAGPTVGGFIADRWDWRWIFTFNVPLGLLALPLIQLALFDLPAPATHPPPKDRRDLAGLVALVVGIGTLQTVLEWGGRADWFRSPLITWCALVAVVGLVLFVGHELRASAPVVSLRVFQNRTFTVGALFMAVAGCCQSSSVVLSSLYSARVMDYSALATGLVLAPAGIATAGAMLLAGMLQPRVGSQPLIVGRRGAGGGRAGAAELADAGGGPVAAGAPRMVVGLGFGLLFVALATFTLSDLSANGGAAGDRRVQSAAQPGRQRRHRAAAHCPRAGRAVPPRPAGRADATLSLGGRPAGAGTGGAAGCARVGSVHRPAAGVAALHRTTGRRPGSCRSWTATSCWRWCCCSPSAAAAVGARRGGRRESAGGDGLLLPVTAAGAPAGPVLTLDQASSRRAGTRGWPRPGRRRPGSRRGWRRRRRVAALGGGRGGAWSASSAAGRSPDSRSESSPTRARTASSPCSPV